MSVRAESDRHAGVVRELENFRRGINLATIFPQASGVQLDGNISLLRGGKKFFEQWRAVTLWYETKLLRQISVTDDFKQLRLGCHRQPLEVNVPNLKRIPLFPLRELFRIVHVPRVAH